MSVHHICIIYIYICIYIYIYIGCLKPLHLLGPPGGKGRFLHAISIAMSRRVISMAICHGSPCGGDDLLRSTAPSLSPGPVHRWPWTWPQPQSRGKGCFSLKAHGFFGSKSSTLLENKFGKPPTR